MIVMRRPNMSAQYATGNMPKKLQPSLKYEPIILFTKNDEAHHPRTLSRFGYSLSWQGMEKHTKDTGNQPYQIWITETMAHDTLKINTTGEHV